MVASGTPVDPVPVDPVPVNPVVFPEASGGAAVSLAGDGTVGEVREWDVPPGWNQGRGAWGGLVVTAAVRAAQGAGADGPGDVQIPERPIRSVSAQLAAPVPPGTVRLAIEDIRRGSATLTRRVVVSDGDVGTGADAADVLAHLTVLAGDPRRGVDDGVVDGGGAAIAPPDAPAAEAIETVPIGPPLGPEFARHLRFRPITGLPYGGGGEDVLCWIAPAVIEEVGSGRSLRYDAGALLGLVDALWPAVLTRFTSVRPVATVDFLATLLVDPDTVDPVDPLLHRGRVVASHGGYVTETRELWTSDGRLAVVNQQVVAIIR